MSNENQYSDLLKDKKAIQELIEFSQEEMTDDYLEKSFDILYNATHELIGVLDSIQKSKNRPNNNGKKKEKVMNLLNSYGVLSFPPHLLYMNVCVKLIKNLMESNGADVYSRNIPLNKRQLMNKGVEYNNKNGNKHVRYELSVEYNNNLDRSVYKVFGQFIKALLVIIQNIRGTKAELLQSFYIKKYLEGGIQEVLTKLGYNQGRDRTKTLVSFLKEKSSQGNKNIYLLHSPLQWNNGSVKIKKFGKFQSSDKDIFLFLLERFEQNPNSQMERLEQNPNSQIERFEQNPNSQIEKMYLLKESISEQLVQNPVQNSIIENSNRIIEEIVGTPSGRGYFHFPWSR